MIDVYTHYVPILILQDTDANTFTAPWVCVVLKVPRSLASCVRGATASGVGVPGADHATSGR